MASRVTFGFVALVLASCASASCAIGDDVTSTDIEEIRGAHRHHHPASGGGNAALGNAMPAPSGSGGSSGGNGSIGVGSAHPASGGGGGGGGAVATGPRHPGAHHHRHHHHHNPGANECDGLAPTIVGTDGDDNIHGTPGRDIIWAGAGDDTIDGLGGDDVICGGPGNDTIYGGDGDDAIQGGDGNDVIFAGNGEDDVEGGDGNDIIDLGAGNDDADGGAGQDLIHGRAGSDAIHGGPDNDAIYGDILDDDLYGDDGDDLIVGGHGNDFMHGGGGNDFLRGDTGHDTFVGGDGDDIASFETAMPPGERLNPSAGPAPEGVWVDFNEHLVDGDESKKELEQHDLGAQVGQAFVASGDGVREGLLGIETIIGSPFNDRLVASSDTKRLVGGYGDDEFTAGANVAIDDGPGNDVCNGTACDNSGEPAPRSAGAFVFVSDDGAERGLVVMGAQGNVADALSITTDGTYAVVTATNNAMLTPGTNCTSAGNNVVRCNGVGSLQYVTAYGGDGDDQITMGGGFTDEMTAHIDGGTGSDTLNGGPGADVLFSGPNGNDRLYGHAGDDALLSETDPSEQSVTHVDSYASGADVLDGGDGNDQLVSDFPCGGHTFIGGPGIDIAGFRRSTPNPPYYGISAQLGGPSSVHQPFWGRAYSPDRCDLNPWGTTIAPDLEILEGGEGDDHLYGDDTDNTIWAWDGNDEVYGYGGNDVLEGHGGDDQIYGGLGRDVMLGGEGNDTLYARDGQVDFEISCGEGGGTVFNQDRIDPNPIGCN